MCNVRDVSGQPLVTTGGGALPLPDAYATSHAHRDERSNQSDEKLFHWNLLLITQR